MPTRADEIQRSRVFSESQRLFPDISYTSFTYPGDEEALAALKHVPGAPALLIYLQKNFTEELVFVENNEQMVRASARSFPSLHGLVARCCEILSCPMPDVYVTTNPVMNAYTVGHRRTCIVLHSSIVEALTADELSFVIGHEVGHIKCGHGLYRQLGSLLLQYWDSVASLIPVPGLGLVRIPLLLAYWNWYRRAEFTCDRAGLLCVQALEPALMALGKLAGKVTGFEDEFDIESTISQCLAHKEVNKLVLVVSILNNAQNTHPFIPLRLKQMHEYSESADYQKVVQGDYVHDPLGLHEGGVRIKCKCGTEVNIKLNFCPKCGRAMDPEPVSEIAPGACVCSGCGNVLAADVRFCPKCGTAQEATSAKPESALDRLRSKTPGFLKRS
jgi:Zn-dependent protease with chaperone function